MNNLNIIETQSLYIEMHDFIHNNIIMFDSDEENFIFESSQNESIWVKIWNFFKKIWDWIVKFFKGDPSKKIKENNEKIKTNSSAILSNINTFSDYVSSSGGSSTVSSSKENEIKRKIEEREKRKKEILDKLGISYVSEETIINTLKFIKNLMPKPDIGEEDFIKKYNIIREPYNQIMKFNDVAYINLYITYKEIFKDTNDKLLISNDQHFAYILAFGYITIIFSITIINELYEKIYENCQYLIGKIKNLQKQFNFNENIILDSQKYTKAYNKLIKKINSGVISGIKEVEIVNEKEAKLIDLEAKSKINENDDIFSYIYPYNDKIIFSALKLEDLIMIYGSFNNFFDNFVKNTPELREVGEKYTDLFSFLDLRKFNSVKEISNATKFKYNSFKKAFITYLKKINKINRIIFLLTQLILISQEEIKLFLPENFNPETGYKINP